MPIAALLTPASRDLGGGFTVRRLLPSALRPSVGPFVFFDHFGPITAGPQDQHDVRPHPHIGLATVTYLFEGAMMHRDSTGAVQRIEPGAINWMTAGRGIVHSERTPDDLRAQSRRSHGLQLWAALPTGQEEAEPAFAHTPAADIPQRDLGGSRVRVLIGEAFGERSPVRTLSPTLYLDLQMSPGATLDLPAGDGERAVYLVDGDLTVDGNAVAAAHMAVLVPGSTVRLGSVSGARLAVVGGEPLGKRHLWWNFVSSRIERIHQAQDDWQAGRFDPVPGETEFIPLPPTRR